MYKFTNGIVVFDKETRDRYIEAGMTLVNEVKEKVNEGNPNSGLDKNSEFNADIKQREGTSESKKKFKQFSK